MQTLRLVTSDGLREIPDLDQWDRDSGHGFLWIDVRLAKPSEVQDLADRFGFHDVCVEACLNPYSRPILHQFQSYLCINLTLIHEPGEGITPDELHVFVGKDFIVTVILGDKGNAPDALLKEYSEDPGLAERGTLYAMYLVAEALVDSYMPLVEQLDESVDDLEHRMLQNPDKAAVQELFRLKRRLYDLRRMLGPQRDVFTELARRRLGFAQQTQEVFFNDLYSRMIYLFDIMDTTREALSNAMDIYLSATSNRLNEIMKVLTVASTILMTLSFITGFYGMNFVFLPWLHSPNAFRNVSATMAVVTGFMLYLFRRRGWL
jgi:magnesium transporter